MKVFALFALAGSAAAFAPAAQKVSLYEGLARQAKLVSVEGFHFISALTKFANMVICYFAYYYVLL